MQNKITTVWIAFQGAAGGERGCNGSKNNCRSIKTRTEIDYSGINK